MGIFALFAIATQIQFNKISDDKIYEARLDTYNSDVKAYDVAITAYDNCMASVGLRDTYRGIFAGISLLFKETADLPMHLFPDSEPAKIYQEELTAGIERYILEPVDENLPPRDPLDCPAYPTDVPEKPE